MRPNKSHFNQMMIRQNHFNAAFIGHAIVWEEWTLAFATSQLDLWNAGVRDGRIHDSTFGIGAQSKKREDQIVQA